MQKSTQVAPRAVPRRGFFGWRVVAAAFTIALFAWGIGFYGPPIFLGVLHATRGWSVALVSSAITVHFLCGRSEEHTSELQSLMRISYAVLCLKKKKKTNTQK